MTFYELVCAFYGLTIGSCWEPILGAYFVLAYRATPLGGGHPLLMRFTALVLAARRLICRFPRCWRPVASLAAPRLHIEPPHILAANCL